MGYQSEAQLEDNLIKKLERQNYERADYITSYDEMVQNGDYEVPKVFVPIMNVNKSNLEDWVENVAPEGWISMEEITG